MIALEISTSAWLGLTYSAPYTQPWWGFGFLFFCPNNYSASGQISIVGLGSMSPELFLSATSRSQWVWGGGIVGVRVELKLG